MNLEHLAAARDVGNPDHDFAVEPPRPPERGVERVWKVRRADDDDLTARFEPVHQRQQLRDDALLHLADRVFPPRRDRVDLVEKDNAWRGLLRLLEHLAKPRLALPVQPVHDFGSADGEKGRLGFAGHGARQQRFAAAGRTVEQDALGRVDAEAAEDLRIPQRQLDHLAHALDGRAQPTDVFVGDPAGRRLRAGRLEPRDGIRTHHHDPAGDGFQDPQLLETRAESGDAETIAGGDRHVHERSRDLLGRQLPQDLRAFGRHHHALGRGRLDDGQLNSLTDNGSGVAPYDAVDLHELPATAIAECRHRACCRNPLPRDLHNRAGGSA